MVMNFFSVLIAMFSASKTFQILWPKHEANFECHSRYTHKHMYNTDELDTVLSFIMLNAMYNFG